jgi:predicted transcriptional regulator
MQSGNVGEMEIAISDITKLSTEFENANTKVQELTKVMRELAPETMKVGEAGTSSAEKYRNMQTELAKKNIVDLLQNEDLNSRQIEQKTQFSKDVILDALKYLLDNDTIYINPNNDYSLK